MKKEKNARRSFLKHILAGSAVIAGSVSSIRSAKAQTASKSIDPSEILYQESEEFKKYYKTLKS